MTCPCRMLCLVPKPECSKAQGQLPRHRATGPALAKQVMALPLFSGLDHDILERLMADSTALTVERRSLLFSAGAQADCFYIVLDGQVKLLALTDTHDGQALVALPFNKEILASRVGIRRESLSRVLARLRDMGVRTEGNAVRIDDVASLRQRCSAAQ